MTKAIKKQIVLDDDKTTGKNIKKAVAASKKTTASTPNNTVAVDVFMSHLAHPLKKEIEAVRSIIKKADSNIKEQVKWNAPSFFHLEDLVTFNPRLQTAVHLVFHHPGIVNIHSPLLEGDYKDRRMMYLNTMEQINSSKTEIENIITKLIRLLDH
jgi:hypothetical protein